MEKVKKLGIWRMTVYFIIYCILGYVIETLFALINYNVIESRQSFLYGPFSGVYGVGAVVLIYFLRYFNKNNYTLFFGGCLIGAVVEYLVSLIGEVMFDARWWDYSRHFLNINGRICLLYTLFWGILSLALVRIINPKIDKFIDFIKSKFNIKFLKVLTILFMIFLIVNAVASSIAMQIFLIRMTVENDLNVENKEIVVEKYNNIYGNEKARKFIEKFWGDKKMITTYPNVTLKLEDGTIIYVHDLLPNIRTYLYKWDKDLKF